MFILDALICGLSFWAEVFFWRGYGGRRGQVAVVMEVVEIEAALFTLIIGLLLLVFCAGGLPEVDVMNGKDRWWWLWRWWRVKMSCLLYALICYC